MASIGTILVPITALPADRDALQMALAVAKALNGHVEALYVQPNPAETLPFFGMPLMPENMHTIVQAEAKIGEAAARAVRTAVEEMCLREQIILCDLSGHSCAGSCTFRSAWGQSAATVAARALLADMVAIRPVYDRNGPSLSGAFLRVLLEVGRPILVAPRHPARVFRKIAVGWDGSHAAATALRTALPFLTRAEQVEIVRVARSREDEPIDGLDAYLTRAGVAHSFRTVEQGGTSVGKTLLRAATDFGADLMVMGGFSHRPLIEALVGGVTDTFLHQATIPVLLSH